jgi:hypothetical protein
VEYDWPFVQAGLRLGASQSAADSESSSAWNWRRVSSSSSRMRFPTSLSLTSSPLKPADVTADGC